MTELELQMATLIKKLDIEVMQPSMSGDHQCSIRHNCGRLTPVEWALVFDIRDNEEIPYDD